VAIKFKIFENLSDWPFWQAHVVRRLSFHFGFCFDIVCNFQENVSRKT
jgi:hypothetical protein